MTTRLSRERAVTSALDHLHTAGPALARYASKVTVDAAPASSVPSEPSPTLPGSAAEGRRTPTPPRWRAFAALAAVLLTGFAGATFAGSAPISTNPPANSVLAFGAAKPLGSGANLALHAGVIAIASDPVGPGYWLAAADGGVFAFGDASFYGSTGNTTLNAPMVGIAPTPHGRGYWLVGADGGVFAFGDARFLGSAQSVDLARPIVGAAATRTGKGYWLLGSDGGVFSFGDARFAGAFPNADQPDAVGIAASNRGRGYWIARADGSVVGFHVRPRGNDAIVTSIDGNAPTVAIAASPNGGYWIAQGALHESPVSSLASDPFLTCTRAHESDSAGGYQAVSAGGTYRGAYQFDRSTWDSAARIANRPDLVGVDPAAAAPADQDLLALNLFRVRGAQPWGGRCAGLT
jgi:hypothetical protein